MTKRFLWFLSAGVALGLLLAVLSLGCGPSGGPSPTATPAKAVATPAAKEQEVPAPYKGKKNPFSVTDQSALAAGKRIYEQNCLSCHGEKGDGKGPAGAALKPAPPNFSSAAQMDHFERVQDHHFWQVSEGVPGTSMPAWKGSLTEEQRWQVLTYEWSLGKSK